MAIHVVAVLTVVVLVVDIVFGSCFSSSCGRISTTCLVLLRFHFIGQRIHDPRTGKSNLLVVQRMNLRENPSKAAQHRLTTKQWGAITEQ